MALAVYLNPKNTRECRSAVAMSGRGLGGKTSFLETMGDMVTAVYIHPPLAPSPGPPQPIAVRIRTIRAARCSASDTFVMESILTT